MDDIPPTLEGWVYIIPIHEPLDEPLYTHGLNIHQHIRVLLKDLSYRYDPPCLI